LDCTIGLANHKWLKTENRERSNFGSYVGVRQMCATTRRYAAVDPE